MEQNTFDVIIVGAGPSGSACAISLANAGLQVALVDKATFPRDKTCGDALGIDVINQLGLISPDLAAKFKALENKSPSYGIKIFSADSSCIAIPLMYKNVKQCGYVIPRMDFDNFLFQYAKECPGIHCFENCTIEKIEQVADGITVKSKDLLLKASMLVGSDGAHSVVAKQLNNAVVDKEHYSAGLRVYYDGISGFHKDNLIELHFFDDVVPGYFWLFPLANGRANVGIGMLSSVIAEKNINIKEVLQKIITTKPFIKERFSNAKALETVKGYGLPLGSKRRPISGERFVLTGDAASLIDPFTGEGIANAIRSGRIAAKHVINCTQAADFSAAFNKKYDDEVYCKMLREFKISRLLLKLSVYPRLCNLIVRKANSNKYIFGLLTDALASVDKRKSLLTKPKFYYKLFFSGKKEPVN